MVVDDCFEECFEESGVEVVEKFDGVFVVDGVIVEGGELIE